MKSISVYPSKRRAQNEFGRQPPQPKKMNRQFYSAPEKRQKYLEELSPQIKKARASKRTKSPTKKGTAA